MTIRSVIFPKRDHFKADDGYTGEIHGSFQYEEILHLNDNELLTGTQYLKSGMRSFRQKMSVVKEKQTTTKPVLLHVEDAPEIRLLIKIFLKNHFTVISASSGEEALKLIETRSFDLVLMDIDLGDGMNGIETTKELKKLNESGKLPVVAATSNSYYKMREQCIEADMQGFIQKPFSQAELLQTLQKIIKISQEQ